MTRLGLNLLTPEPSTRNAEVMRTLVTDKGVRLGRIEDAGRSVNAANTLLSP
jgi:hypothetical protein